LINYGVSFNVADVVSLGIANFKVSMVIPPRQVMVIMGMEKLGMVKMSGFWKDAV